jgi:hypothetical protein
MRSGRVGYPVLQFSGRRPIEGLADIVCMPAQCNRRPISAIDRWRVEGSRRGRGPAPIATSPRSGLLHDDPTVVAELARYGIEVRG